MSPLSKLKMDRGQQQIMQERLLLQQLSHKKRKIISLVSSTPSTRRPVLKERLQKLFLTQILFTRLVSRELLLLPLELMMQLQKRVILRRRRMPLHRL
jgi:hypothetical protein